MSKKYIKKSKKKKNALCSHPNHKLKQMQTLKSEDGRDTFLYKFQEIQNPYPLLERTIAKKVE